MISQMCLMWRWLKLDAEPEDGLTALLLHFLYAFQIQLHGKKI